MLFFFFPTVNSRTETKREGWEWDEMGMLFIAVVDDCETKRQRKYEKKEKKLVHSFSGRRSLFFVGYIRRVFLFFASFFFIFGVSFLLLLCCGWFPTFTADEFCLPVTLFSFRDMSAYPLYPSSAFIISKKVSKPERKKRKIEREKTFSTNPIKPCKSAVCVYLVSSSE